MFSDLDEDFDGHGQVTMPSLEALATPTSGGPGGFNSSAAGHMGQSGVGASAMVGGSRDDFPGLSKSFFPQVRGSVMLFDRLSATEPNTQGMPYEAACREWAKWYLIEGLLPVGVPDPQVSLKPSSLAGMLLWLFLFTPSA